MSARMQCYAHSSCKQQRRGSQTQQEGLGPGPWTPEALTPQDRTLPFSLCAAQSHPIPGFPGRTARLRQVGGHQGSRQSCRDPVLGDWPCFLALCPVEFTSPLHSFQLPLALSLPSRAGMEKVRMISSSSLGEQVWGLQGRQARPPSRRAPFCPSHPALCFWSLASSPCGVANRGPAELWRGGVNVVTPLHPHCRPGSGYVSWSPSPIASAQSGGKGPHPCCPGASSPFLIPRRSSLKRLVCVFCSCWDLAGEDPSLIPTELSLKPMVVVTLFCKGHYCLQFSILCLN